MKKSGFAILMVACLWACRGAAVPPPSGGESAGRSETHWTDKTELFLESPALAAGEVSRFSVHLTDLRDGKPLRAGRVTVELRAADGAAEAFRAEAPSRPGIFGIDVKPSRAGTPRMSIRLVTESLEDVHELGNVEVFTSRSAAGPSKAGNAVEAIAYLKEQQWTMEFGTAVAADQPVHDSLRVPAQVRPRMGGEAVVIAPVDGRISPASAIPAAGTLVEAGQILARLIPRTAAPADRPTLELAVTEATSALSLAAKERQRIERLVSAGALPGRRLDEAAAGEKIALARLEAAQAVFAQYEVNQNSAGETADSVAYVLRSPLAGFLAESAAVLGAGVEAGQALFRVLALDPVHIVAHVPEGEASRLRSISGGELEPAADRPAIPLGRVISIGRVVDPDSRTLAVVFEMANPEYRLPIGQSVYVRLFAGPPVNALAVPESAIVDDAGRPVVFVQIGGESFLRRPVRLGVREAGYVSLVEGVARGERIVTRGAYQIRLAALSPQVPAHGHVH